MQIKNMFEKQIDRDIKGVIKVGQSDEENIYQEIRWGYGFLDSLEVVNHIF